MWKRSELIRKGELRLCQLAEIDPAEIITPFNNDEIDTLWEESEPCQRDCSNFFGDINNNDLKSKRIQLIKRTNWILPRIVQDTHINGTLTFYTDANKPGKAGYKSVI